MYCANSTCSAHLGLCTLVTERIHVNFVRGLMDFSSKCHPQQIELILRKIPRIYSSVVESCNTRGS
jgi:hypothetical protein